MKQIQSQFEIDLEEYQGELLALKQVAPNQDTIIQTVKNLKVVIPDD